jgi:hypothetical protein
MAGLPCAGLTPGRVFLVQVLGKRLGHVAPLQYLLHNIRQLALRGKQTSYT